MLLSIPDILTKEQLVEARRVLEQAEWVDGRVTAGYQSAIAKDNMQVREGHPAAIKVGEMILEALGKSRLFMSAALPLKVFPPLFNRYQNGQSFGTHVDNAIRQVPGTPYKIRTDLSATLFLNGPDEYEGGELVIEDTYGVQRIKLSAGHLVLYPSTSLHHVRPGDARDAPRLLFLDSEHGPRRCPAVDPVRSRFGDSAAGAGSGPSVGRAIDRRLSQPAAALVGGELEEGCKWRRFRPDKR
ncbi:MAG: Fe2+-dependent dioxygenase [Candidatus Manganitrophus sp.]|nr:Fe2+-dependent dioxygenase [Candidatus Manganitrophus sp.]